MNINLKPIAYVSNSRKEVVDDYWSEIISEITLIESIGANALNGIEDFSHLEIIFYMDKVNDEKAIAQCRHPRNDKKLPQVGTFAQRNKNRPNKLGLTTVEFVRKKDKTIIVRNLDAVHSTAILDIKPVFKEFQAKGEIVQAKWTHKVMENYF